MYNSHNLKPRIRVDDYVDCPVVGCSHRVARQFKRFQRQPLYLCEEHGIYISPSTHDYLDLQNNFPLVDARDYELLRDKVGATKRESHRLGRERSEDAVTYNVFRTIERRGLLDGLLTAMTGKKQSGGEVIYWAYSARHSGLMPELLDARRVFEYAPDKGSEPDLIVVTDGALVVIEVKLTSGNNTQPSRTDVLPRYAAGANGLYDDLFTEPIEEVAVGAKKYELMRFWLLGSWMANQMRKQFELVSLVRDAQDAQLESQFGSMLRQTPERRYSRFTWERLHDYAQQCGDADDVVDYLESKTIGYDAAGALQLMMERANAE